MICSGGGRALIALKQLVVELEQRLRVWLLLFVVGEGEQEDEGEQTGWKELDGVSVSIPEYPESEILTKADDGGVVVCCLKPFGLGVLRCRLTSAV